MKSSAQVVVIGGGVVGASVLYHLTEAGWTDVVLVERKELTAGSTWHSAGRDAHAQRRPQRLQAAAVHHRAVPEDRGRAPGQSCSIHLPGGLMLADDRERLDWLRMAQARGRYLGMDLEIISPGRGQGDLPAPGGAVLRRRAVRSGRGPRRPQRRHQRLRDLRPPGRAPRSTATPGSATCASGADGTWDVITDQGDIHAEHIVNAGGLWAREVGRMIGFELPVLGMEHMYLVTEAMAEVAEHNARTGRGDADGPRLRGRDLHPPGAAEGC